MSNNSMARVPFPSSPGHDDPQRRMCVLPAVFPDAGEIPPHVSRVERRFVEGRGEQEDETVRGIDELFVNGVHCLSNAIALRPAKTPQLWARESMRHSSFSPNQAAFRRRNMPADTKHRPRRCSRLQSALGSDFYSLDRSRFPRLSSGARTAAG